MIMDTPQLRPGLAAASDDDANVVIVHDPNRIVPLQLSLSVAEFECARRINGKKTVAELHQQTGHPLSFNEVVELVRKLDEHLFLHNERFFDYLFGPDRLPSCIGCYSPDPAELRSQMADLFTAPGGPGLPDEPGCRIGSDGPVRAVLVPHIDYARGGVSYGWGFKELIERTDASLFVIIGTSHYSGERFTLTRKDFTSPLGTVPTDQIYIDKLEAAYGDGLFNDPVAHLPEHSIELEVVLLQYLLEGRRPFRIVPLLVGSFHDCIDADRDPMKAPDIARMVEALKMVEAQAGETVCYVISGDLAHIGPKFDDPKPLTDSQLRKSKAADEELMQAAERMSIPGYFGQIAAEGNRRRICGLPPTWLTLTAAQPNAGKLLHYGQYAEPNGYESVSFASMAFG